MMKKEKSKEMTGKEPTAKNKVIETAAPVIKKIRCIRECHMHGAGAFKGGEVIEDQGKIALIGDNPNFESVKED